MPRAKKLKLELIEAAVCVVVAAFALTVTTYAWYVANNRVTAKTSSINVTTNGFVLQIDSLEKGAQHGGEQKSLEASSLGATLSPSSSDDLSHWYDFNGWDERGDVTSYHALSFDEKPGHYKDSGGKDYYAYSKSDYIVYTITQTGNADVYLDGSEGDPIKITSTNGGEIASAVKGSMRIAVTTQEVGPDGKSGIGPETLKVVYAFDDEAGKKGNDKYSEGGWVSVRDVDGTPSVRPVSYPYIYSGHYYDQLDANRNWAATKSGDSYVVPAGSEPIAKGVGYNGIAVHVYIWLEGTDSDCINGKSIENDPSTYDVTVKLAGVAAN